MRTFTLLLLLTVTLTATTRAAEKPNVIIIMTDDVGYGDVSCNGYAWGVETPNIDRMAKEGLRFTNGYCTASTCSPTRFSLITGKYAWRQKNTGIAPPNASARILPGTPTIATMFDAAGYETAIVGKWHLGLGTGPKPNWGGEIKPGPCEIGFNYAFIIPTTNDRVPSVYVENHTVYKNDPKDPVDVFDKNPDGQPTPSTTPRDQLRLVGRGHNGTVHNGVGRIGFQTGGKKAKWRDEDIADDITEKALAFIEKNKEQPFFLLFTTNDIHAPRLPHERFLKKSKLGLRGDALVQMDWCVGEVLNHLREWKLAEKTLVVFCSDNGPRVIDAYDDHADEVLGDHKPAGPFRGGKYTINEGGTRTPFITWFPGTIKPGVSDKLVSTMDLYASLAALVGGKLAPNAAPDSVDVLPALLGKKGAKGRDHLLLQRNSAGGGLAVRQGDWRYIQNKKGGELYNLAKDVGEKNNVAAANPEKVQELEALIERARKK